MVVEKNHETISFKQNKWLEKYISFNTQKRNNAKNEFEKKFLHYLIFFSIVKQRKMYKNAQD